MEHNEVPEELRGMVDAARTGDFLKIQKYHKQGADINQPCGDITSLHAAATGGYTEIVEYLLRNGASVDQPVDPWYEGNEEAGFRALHCAVREGHVKVAKQLVEAGAKIDKVSWWPNLFSPLHVAVGSANIDAVKFLLDSGANVNKVTGPNAGTNTALHLAVQNEDEAMVKLLLDQTVDTEVLNEYGKTASCIATTERIRQLIITSNKKKSLVGKL